MLLRFFQINNYLSLDFLNLRLFINHFKITRYYVQFKYFKTNLIISHFLNQFKLDLYVAIIQ
jgi:hypothetical protein